MSDLRRVEGGLQVNQHLEFERRERLVQRGFWVIAATALLACLLGLLGGTGVLSERSRTTADGAMRVDYDRFARLSSPMSLDVTFDAGVGARTVALASTWLEDVELRGVTPQPARTRVTADRSVFTFDVAPGGRVRFDVAPSAIGVHRATVWGPDGQRIAFSQFVYP